MRKVQATEAKTRLAELLRAVEAIPAAARWVEARCPLYG